MFNGVGVFQTLVSEVKNLFQNTNSNSSSDQQKVTQGNSPRTPKTRNISANPLLTLANQILSTKGEESITIDGQKYYFFVTYEDNQQRTETEKKIDSSMKSNTRFLDIELVRAPEELKPISNADKIAESILKIQKDKKTITINRKSYSISHSTENNTATLTNLNQKSRETITLKKDKKNKPLRLEITAKGTQKVFDFSQDTVIRLRAQVDNGSLKPLSIISKGPNGLLSYAFNGALRLDCVTQENTCERYNLSNSGVNRGQLDYSDDIKVKFT